MTDQTEVLICHHCGNTAPMKIVASWVNDLSDIDEAIGQVYFRADCRYETLICSACNKPSFRSIEWNETMEVGDLCPEILYPQSVEISLGLPEEIQKLYESARRVKNIDANSYAVSIGRLLEMICKDKGATGNVLADQLKDLSSKGVIPDKLSTIAKRLKDHRNIGAHATMGELTEEDVPLLEKLTRAILEYVYTAPALAEQAEAQFAKLKGKENK